MKKDKTVRVLPRQDSSQLSPKKREGLQRTWKEQASKLRDALNQVEQQLNLFLIDNFSLVHDGAFEAYSYHQKVLHLLDELRVSQLELLGDIFKKLKSVVEPLMSQRPSGKKAAVHPKERQSNADLQSQLKLQQHHLANMRQENNKLRTALKQQAERNEQNRKKQNRMTELLYILRKKNIDIDRIYEDNCQTPGFSKKTSALQEQLQQYEFEP